MFTDLRIKNLPAREQPYREWENGPDRGFGVQVTPTRTITFFVFYSFHGKRRFMSLGRYPDTSLKGARRKYREARNLREQGIDPQDHREAEQEQHREAAIEAKRKHREAEQQGNIKQLFDAYVTHLKANGKRSWKEVQRALNHDALPVMGQTTKAADITSHHVRLALHRVIARGAEIGANRLRSYLSAAFQFGIEHDHHPRNMVAEVLFHLTINPAREVPKPIPHEAPGERDLSAAEIRDLWEKLPESGLRVPTQIAFKLILATGGQRIGEIIGARWAEFDLTAQRWEIPTSRTKNHRTHVLPLTPLALHLLADLAPYSAGSAYLFPKNRGDRNEPMPLASMSKAMARFCTHSEFAKFQPRDLRRTCKTRMGEIGISKEIRDRIHNHALNDVSSKHYDRYSYFPEKQQAMAAWGDWLNTIIPDSK